MISIRRCSSRGWGGDTAALVPGQARNEAIMGVLRPEQVEVYETHRREQIAEAEEDLREIGLRLPPD